MFILAVTLIIIGIIFLVSGLTQAKKICAQAQHTGWKWLSLLIACFILGYSLVLGSLIVDKTVDPILFGLSMILFSGSIFVFMVTKFSLSTIQQLHMLAQEEKHNALHDPLTALPNRKHCIETVNFLVEDNIPFQLMLLDVVNFKQVNDGMGHFCGDQLLIQIGHRSRAHLSKGDFIARIGGDEFVVVMPNQSLDHAFDIAHKINQSLKRPFSIDGFELTSSVIVGIGSYPKHGASVEQIINAADVAMYWAKTHGNEVAHFSSHMSQDARRKLQISRQIDQAIENNEFQLFYQPIICLKRDIVCSYEALMRWLDEDGKPITPSDFITIAEQSNKITSITEWMLDKVASDIEKLVKAGIHCPIHVNLSAKDLMSKNLENQLSRLAFLNKHFVKMVVLEITETTAINRLRSPATLLERLKQMGFRISLDDFGTGFSSLSLLRDLPVDQIKIDQSFVYQMQRNERNRSIVANSISLAHGLGYTVVSEGVEHEEVINILKEHGCDYVQGYFYSPALPLERAINWTLSRDAEHYEQLAQHKIKKAAP